MKQTKYVKTMLAVLLLAGVLAPAAEAAGQNDPGWRIRFYAAAIDMESGADGSSQTGTVDAFDMDVGAGVGFNAEYRFSPRLGVDLGILGGAGVDIETGRYWARNSVRGTYEDSYDSLTMTPLTAGLDIHLTPNARVDFYACPMVALVQYGGLAVRSGPSGVRWDWDFDEDVALGAALGVGVPLGENRWSFQANLTYLDSSLEGRAQDGTRVVGDYGSTIFGLGFGYRFGG